MKKILIVEDEHAIASIIGDFLRERDFEVDIAYNLAEGLEKCTGEHDMVLLDIKLRAEMGFPILEKIKNEFPSTVVLVFSGYDSEDNIRKAKQLGADGFIPKPFRLEFLEDFLIPKIESLSRAKRGIL